ncbi:lipoprotein receptor [Sorangium sp. So ce302]|uniref:lipoprotein receptor n=1 Tax=Sorangium sp. So ce302 TaxID=3133297 RepID=UPI003F63573C
MRQAFGIGSMVCVAIMTAAACTSVLGDFTVSEASASSAGGSDACATGTADCDGNPDDCEVNLLDNPQNCGACGAVCLDGGTCSATGCSGATEIARGFPTIEAPNANLLTVYQGEVYWTAGEGTDGSVQKVSILGGAVTTLAVGQNAPYGIAVNQHGVFWSNLNDKDVLMVDRNGARAPEVLFDSDFATLGVAADDNAVFWAQRAAGIGTPGDGSLIGQILMPGEWADDEFLEVSNASPHLIALDQEHVYWVDRSLRGTVNQTHRQTRDTKRLADEQPFPYAIAVDDDHVYWTNSPRGDPASELSAVMRAPKDGSEDAVVVWTAAEDDDVAHASPDCIAVDGLDEFVYWTDQGSPRVMRKLKDGTGRARPLYEGGTPRGIALAGGVVYWADESSGTIRKLPR